MATYTAIAYMRKCVAYPFLLLGAVATSQLYVPRAAACSLRVDAIERSKAAAHMSGGRKRKLGAGSDAFNAQRVAQLNTVQPVKTFIKAFT